MNSQEPNFNGQYGDSYIFPPNIVEHGAQQEIHQPNTQYQVNNQVSQPQIEYQAIQPAYQPNVQYPANDQFYQPNVDLNPERTFTAPLQNEYQVNHQSNLNPEEMQSPQQEKKKRTRTRYTSEQIKYLEEEFKRNPYITIKKKRELSTMLEMEQQQIKKWFQNRRMKESLISKRRPNYSENNENPRQNMWSSFQIGNSKSNELPGQSSTNIGGYGQHNINFGGGYFAENSFPQISNNYPFQNQIQNPGPILSSQLEYFYPMPLQESNKNIFNNYVSGTNTNENSASSFNVTPSSSFENFSPSSSQENNQSICYNNYYFGSNTNQNLVPSIEAPSSSLLENFPWVPAQESHRSIYDNYYYGSNRNENFAPNVDTTQSSPLENLNPSTSQDHQNIFKNDDGTVYRKL